VKKIAALVLVACGSASPSPKPQATTPPVASSAQAAPTTTPTASAGATFDEEVAFLRAHGAKVEIIASGTGHIAIAPDYQMRVMTSEVAPHGRSLGFVHHAFIEAGKHGTQFDNYGGEDRFWLGPEGGQWGLYFPPGAKYEFGLWQTPHDLQEGAMKRVAVTNHLGTKLEVEVDRHIDVAPTPTELPAGVTWVGFTSRNVITNRGARPISDKDGLISIWILGMYAPAPDTKIIVPFGKGDGPTVNDRYFGKVPAERLVVHEDKGFITMTADGHYRSKIGVPPTRAKQALGSYSPSLGLLTVVTFSDLQPRGYVNSLWEDQKDPLTGDVVNAYNDGPTEPGKPSLGGFYELETSSPATPLAPKATLRHDQTTYHFMGERAALETIAQRMLGVSLADVVVR